MEKLSLGERNLISLGAALASNSLGCVEHYASEARQAGYTDRQIEEAVELADRVRRVPAQNVFDAAIGLFSRPAKPALATTQESEGGRPNEEGRPAAEVKTGSADTASPPTRTHPRCCS